MFELKKVPLPNYSRAEEIMNSATHAVGAPLCIIGLVLLLRMQVGKLDGVQIFSTVLYMLSSLLVFAGSAIYHGLKPGFAKQVARVLDHANIYLMISGTVTAFFMAHVYPTNAKLSIRMVILVWSLSVIGIVLTFMDLKKFNIPQIFMYIALGWIAIFGMRTVYSGGDAGKAFMQMVLIGGACITVGAMIYLVGKKVRYCHSVFHVFVLAGNIVIYLGTWQYFHTIL